MEKLPQAENGHIDIAHGIAEALAQVNLSPYESRVLWAIFRKTYGWHKKKDAISLSQFQKITGIDRNNIRRTLKGLMEKEIISQNGQKGNINLWGFQKDYKQWKGVSQERVYKDPLSTDPIGSPKTPSGGSPETPISGSPKTPTKEKKETIQKKLPYRGKKNTPPEIKEFSELAKAKTEEILKVKLTIVEYKENALIGRLIKNLGINRLKLLWEYFIIEEFEEDDWLEKIGKTITTFNTRINSLNQNYDGWKKTQEFKIKMKEEKEREQKILRQLEEKYQ